MKPGEVHRMVDVEKAEQFEVTINSSGRVWVNVDGECILRIQLAHHTLIDFKGITILSLTDGVKDA